MHVRHLVLATLFTLPSSLAAQSTGPTAKGNALVGGSAGISRHSTTVDDVDVDESVTVIQFSPNILYFVVPRLAVGGELSYARTSQGEQSSSTTSIGPAIRYYLANPAARAQPYLGATVARQSARFDTSLGESTQKATTFGGVAGVAWMVTRQVGITSEVFYLRTKDSSGGGSAPDVTDDAFGLRFGFAAFLMR